MCDPFNRDIGVCVNYMFDGVGEYSVFKISSM